MRANCRSLYLPGALARVARAGWVGAVVAILGLGAVGRAQAQSWSVPRNLGDLINSEDSEDLPHLSPDGLSLYFISDRPPSPQGKFDIWVSERDSLNHPFRPPTRLLPPINGMSTNERGPCVSPDGHYLFFSSDRIQANSQDLWVSYRDKWGLFGWGPWQAPVNLGPGVNTPYPDFGAAYLENQGTGPTLMFGRREGFGDADIYASEVRLPDWFGDGVLVQELSSPYDDLRPTVRPDGLELFFNSNRPGSVPNDLAISNDLWVSRRSSIFSPWMPPRNVGLDINTEFEEQYPSVSADGSILIFSSNREPGRKNDLYMSRRLPDPHSLP